MLVGGDISSGLKYCIVLIEEITVRYSLCLVIVCVQVVYLDQCSQTFSGQRGYSRPMSLSSNCSRCDIPPT